jgi:predicted Zn-dependent protease
VKNPMRGNMKTLASVVAGIVLALGYAAGAQEESRVPEATKEEILRRLIAISFQARRYGPVPEYYLELKTLGAKLALDDHLRWGKALELAGRPLEALNLLSPLLTDHPDHRPLIREIAQLAVQAQKFETAARLYGLLAELEPDLRSWPLARARALTWARRYKQAEEILEHLVHDSPDRVDADLKKALADVKLGRRQYADAARLLEELHAEDPEDQALERRWIEALAFSGQTDRARERLTRLRSARPGDRALMVLAGDLAMLRRRYSDAIVLYEEAVSKGDAARDTRVKLARAVMADGRVIDATRMYDRLEWEDPRDWELRREKARMLGWKNSIAACLNEYDRLILAYPDNLPLRIERQAKSALFRRDYSRAITEYEELLRLDPANNQALTDLAGLYSEQDMWQEATKAYRAAQEGDPTNPAIQENLDDIRSRRDAFDTTLTTAFSDQMSQERNIDVRRLYAGASLGRWVTDALRLGGRVGQEDWGFSGGSIARSIRADAVLEYVQNPRWSATVDAGYRQYDIGVKGQFVMDARLRYQATGEIEIQAFAVREDFSKNGAVFFEDLYSVRGGFGGLYRVSERLEIDAIGAVGALTDGNGFFAADARMRYLVSEGTGRVYGHYRLHYESFRDIEPLYFTPDGFSVHGLGMAWRLDLSETGKPRPYVELGYEIAFDSGANVNHNFQLGHRYRLAKAVDLGLEAKVMLGDVYEEKRGELFVAVAF